MRVSPFRYPRIDGYVLLPGAFRSLSRLSSALSAKASTLRLTCLTSSGRIALRPAGLLSWLASFASFLCRCPESLPASSSDVLIILRLDYLRFFSVCGFQGTWLTDIYQSSENPALVDSLITGKNQFLYGTL